MTQTQIQPRQMALPPQVNPDDIVLYLFNDDHHLNLRDTAYGITSPADRTIIDLYDYDTNQYVDTYKSLSRPEFKPVIYGKKGTAYGKYYGINTLTCLKFDGLSPDDPRISLDEFEELEFNYKIQKRYRKQKQDAQTPTDRWQQPVLTGKHAMSAPFTWAVSEQPQYGMRDPENYLGRTQVHHITPDTGNDSQSNLILLTDQQHALMHTKPENLTFKVVAELVVMLRNTAPDKIYRFVRSSKKLKQYLKFWLPSYHERYYHRIHDYIYKRFMDVDNHKYDINDSIWDYKTPEDKARIQLLHDYQQLFYDLKNEQNTQIN